MLYVVLNTLGCLWTLNAMLLYISYSKWQKAIRSKILVFVNWLSSNKMKNNFKKSKLINYLYEHYGVMVDSSTLNRIFIIFIFDLINFLLSLWIFILLHNFWHSNNLADFQYKLYRYSHAKLQKKSINYKSDALCLR